MRNKIEEVRAHQRAFLDQVKARSELIPYVIEGVEIIVNPGVFPPATDTKLLASSIKVTKGDRIIDVTTGSGAIAVISGLRGATGLAVDINPRAVENCRENIARYGVQIGVIESDLFDSVPPQRFDQIFANGPFFEGDITVPLDRACYGAKSFVERLLSQLENRLNPGGKLSVILPDWSDLKHLENQVRKNGLSFRVAGTRDSDDGQRTYRLYEVKLSQ